MIFTCNDVVGIGGKKRGGVAAEELRACERRQLHRV